jgi:hypothetical protein
MHDSQYEHYVEFYTVLFFAYSSTFCSIFFDSSAFMIQLHRRLEVALGLLHL